MSAFNLAFIAKLGWKILYDPDNLYLSSCVTNTSGMVISLPRHILPTLLGYGKVFYMLSLYFNQEHACKSQIFDFPIWTTSWIPTIQNFKPLSKFPNNLNFPSPLIFDLINPNSLSWMTITINSIFEEISAREILKIKISRAQGPHYIWTHLVQADFQLAQPTSLFLIPTPRKLGLQHL